MPTLSELTAQQAALTRALAQHELPRHEEAVTLLADLATSTTLTRLAEIVAELPDSGAKAALANVQAAINAASGLIGLHLPRLQELAAPEAA